MKYLLILLSLAVSAQAQTLPADIADTPVMENFEFLNQEIRKERLQRKNFLTSNQTYTGTQTFENIVITGTTSGIIISSDTDFQTGVNWGAPAMICRATATITMVGTKLDIFGTAVIVSLGSPWEARAGILIDGLLPSGWTPSITCSSIVGGYAWSDSSSANLTFTIAESTTLAAGEHSVCLWACSNQGTDPTGTAKLMLRSY